MMRLALAIVVQRAGGAYLLPAALFTVNHALQQLALSHLRE
jgi:hypothetical protein